MIGQPYDPGFTFSQPPQPFPQPGVPQPGVPPPRVPVVVPMVELGGRQTNDWLAEHRRILVSGPLDDEAATMLAAQLMTFDGQSGDEVEIIVTSPGGPMVDIFAVLDVIGLMRAPVATTCIGAATGTAAALVACGTGRRQAARRASLCLRDDASTTIEGSTQDLIGHVEQLTALRTRYLEILAAATGQGEQLLIGELDHGRSHSATEAMALGLIDSIAERSH